MTDDGWMLIETAPKDGTPVVLFEPRGRMKRRYSLNRAGERFVGLFIARSNAWMSIPGDWRRDPTHWQPLPDPPQ